MTRPSNFTAIPCSDTELSMVEKLEKMLHDVNVSKAFKKEVWRQEHPASSHKDTETIYFKMPELITEYSVFHSLDSQWVGNSLARCLAEDLLKQVRFSIMNYFKQEYELGRVMLVKLKPWGHITPHTDEGTYAEHYERFHLPIITSDTAFMRIESDLLNMRRGCVYKIAHRQEHECWNLNGADRVHLIFDMKRSEK